ncbi:MAG TPA: hypothetical protein VHJ78_02015, partial [Actinomycetota bacterium]|nr:hypothetical protein [Actinomycetota bacterium]
DGLCAARGWDELIDLAERCEDAIERGKQLWPIAEHIDYRLALEGPAELAASVLSPDAGRFALGPLIEVAASTHTFEELVPHVASPVVAGVLAGERVIRGEDLRGLPGTHPEILELPMVLLDWEPAYEVATYRASKVTAPAPETSPLTTTARAGAGVVLDEPEVERALLELVTTWVNQSNGSSNAAVVEGPAVAAVGALGEGEFLMGAIEPAAALALMGWAAASGGAHGRRNGAAAGRSAAWWAAGTLLEIDWPPSPDELGEELSKLRWYRWEPLRPVGGWQLHLAVEDPENGWSAAVAAEDRATEP